MSICGQEAQYVEDNWPMIATSKILHLTRPSFLLTEGLGTKLGSSQFVNGLEFTYVTQAKGSSAC